MVKYNQRVLFVNQMVEYDWAGKPTGDMWITLDIKGYWGFVLNIASRQNGGRGNRSCLAMFDKLLVFFRIIPSA